MAKYFVRDSHGYVTEVEAKNYTTDAQTGTFEFFGANPVVRVASFPINTTLSVVEADDAWQDIFPNDELEIEEPETDDVCLGCRFEEFLDSEEFVNAVAEIAADVVEEYHNPDSTTEEEMPPAMTVLKAVAKETGRVEFGFITPEGFVNFSVVGFAVSGLKMYTEGETGWYTADPNNYTFTEVENG
jgi:hypothetical protein